MHAGNGSSVTGGVLLILGLTLVNAFFAGAEMALVSLDWKRLESQGEAGDRKAKMLLRLLEEPSRFLSTIQVGITFAGFFSSASAAVGLSVRLGAFLGNAGIPFGESLAFVGVTVLLSYFVLVFGELVPKRIALGNAEKIARFAAAPLFLVEKALKPFVVLLTVSTNGVLRLSGAETEGMEEKVTLEEIRSLVEVGREQGVINQKERDMINSVISFDTRTAQEIMTPRTEVFLLDLEEPLQVQVQPLLELKHSRVPVYRKDVDNILGVLYIKDFLLEAYRTGFDGVDVEKIMRPAFFVPEKKNIHLLFTELQAARQHMAVLIDEYGGFSGIVTMEDILEEIVGDIDDAYDHEEPDILDQGGGRYLARGSVSIKELNARLGCGLVEGSGDYDTLGGFLIHRLGRIPRPGEKALVFHGDITFQVDKMVGKRVHRVEIRKGGKK
ncbi:hemolysin family protein [Anaerotalea alkaliphila]|uniref:HlyC/CorC family transporter n=1 Tax=Anaerotalea alkaliphila TaxID=2662126 RepID=A0A7X5HUM9_9FIRM|nr:hemolysin family protein [Anaerotalea alkaliphila]NDL66972.1 HlyC/CorC family transporter [Anaerotalea alkaliphila]